MKKNDVIILHIDSILSDGKGIAKPEKEKVVIVPYTAPGDIVETLILKEKSNLAYGKIQKIIKPSPYRKESNCPVFLKCGGCDFLHITKEAELFAKENFIKDAFKHIGNFSDFRDFEKLESVPFSSRNICRFPVGKDGNKIIFGFYRSRSRDIIPINDCPAAHPDISLVSRAVCKLSEKYKISVYNRSNLTGVLRHICVRRAENTGEINVTLVAKRNAPEFTRLAEDLHRAFPFIKGVVLNINNKDTNVIYGETSLTLIGIPYIYDEIGGMRVKISPRSFYQVNVPIAEKLYTEAARAAKPFGKTVLDLYGGIGTVGLFMFRAGAEKVITAEIEPSSKENAEYNFKFNFGTGSEESVSHIYSNDDIKSHETYEFFSGKHEFFLGDSAKAAEKYKNDKINIITLDPPRSGCDDLTIQKIIEINPEKIIMISCDPSTAARDCRKICNNGYIIKYIKGFDMFPGTRHVESLIVMEKE